MWPAADVPVALRELLARRLRVRDYAEGFRRPLDLATVTLDDPLPGLLEVPLQLSAPLRLRRVRRRRA
jgi:predicted ATP-grasp superfamily ATP-dependent carboligase